MRRIMGRMLLGIAAAGLLMGAEPEKDIKKEEGVKGTVLKVDVSRNSITIKTKSGRQTFLVTGDTKYFGSTGAVCENDMNDDRLATGYEVRIVAELSGKTAKEVHLSSGKHKNRGG